MKKVNILLIVALGLSILGRAQTKSILNDEDLKKPIYKSYYVIKSADGLQTSSRNLIIGYNEAEQRIIDIDEKKKKYPNIDADFVVITKIKPGVKLYNLNQLLSEYHVEQKYRNFTVYHEGVEVEDPKTLLADPNYIIDIIINKEKGYINIITKFHEELLKQKKRVNEDRINNIKMLQDLKK